MAAQINKQVAKDSVKTAQKVAHEEKERTARVQIERMQYDGGRRSPSPPRYRSVLSCLVGIGISAMDCWAEATTGAESTRKVYLTVKYFAVPMIVYLPSA